MAGDLGGDFGSRQTRSLALVLMALGTLGAAWVAYQASLWSSVMNNGMVDAIEWGQESGMMRLAAAQQRLIDVGLFTTYVTDRANGSGRLAALIRGRARPEFRAALDAWIATHPLKNPAAPASPFVMPQYKVAADQEAARLAGEADAARRNAQHANSAGDRYALLTVLFSSGLFMAGLVTGLEERGARHVILIFSAVSIALAMFLLFRLPVAHLR